MRFTTKGRNNMLKKKLIPTTNIYENYDEFGTLKYIPKLFRDELFIYGSKKKCNYRLKAKDKKQILEYDWKDKELIYRYKRDNNIYALIELIDNYTPFIKGLYKKPFIATNSKRLKGLQKKLDFYLEKEKDEGYRYIASRADDIMQTILVEFISLVNDFDYFKGSFSGYIKNYIPYSLERTYSEILDDIKNIYIDSISEEGIEQFVLTFLSCNIPENDELDLSNYKLTDKQEIVAKLLSEGLNISQIANELKISRAAVRKHRDLIAIKIEKAKKCA